jgi:hypothetical protein
VARRRTPHAERESASRRRPRCRGPSSTVMQRAKNGTNIDEIGKRVLFYHHGQDRCNCLHSHDRTYPVFLPLRPVQAMQEDWVLLQPRVNHHLRFDQE